MEEQKKTRIGFVDVAKGIGIVLVVLGHSRQPDDPLIFGVHMPLFFFISGYLFSAGKSVGNFIGRKLRGLYIPFAFWNCAGLFVGAALGCFGLTFAKACVKSGWTLVLCEKSPFHGATWFLAGMFAVTILYCLLDKALGRLEIVRRRAVLAAVFAGLSAFAFAVTLPCAWSRPLVLSVFFGIGALVRAVEGRWGAAVLERAAVVPFALLVYVPIALTQTAHQGPNVYSSPSLFVLAGLCGTYALVWLSRRIEASAVRPVKLLAQGLSFLGSRSLDIVIWHFVVFRFIVIAEIWIAGEPVTMKNVLAHYPVYSSESFRWIVYLACGLAVPIVWCSLLRKIPIVRRFHLA